MKTKKNYVAPFCKDVKADRLMDDLLGIATNSGGEKVKVINSMYGA